MLFLNKWTIFLTFINIKKLIGLFEINTKISISLLQNLTNRANKISAMSTNIITWNKKKNIIQISGTGITAVHYCNILTGVVVVVKISTCVKQPLALTMYEAFNSFV